MCTPNRYRHMYLRSPPYPYRNDVPHLVPYRVLTCLPVPIPAPYRTRTASVPVSTVTAPSRIRFRTASCSLHWCSPVPFPGMPHSRIQFAPALAAGVAGPEIAQTRAPPAPSWASILGDLPRSAACKTHGGVTDSRDGRPWTTAEPTRRPACDVTG